MMMISKIGMRLATKSRLIMRRFSMASTIPEEISLSMERSLLNYHQRLAMIKAQENRFTPPKDTLQNLERIEFDPEFASMGINLLELEVYMVNDPKFADYPRNDTSPPSASWMRVVFPFSTSKSLRRGMARVGEKDIRIGRLLEIMDLMAGRVAYSHCDGSFNKGARTVVTASVDGIQFFPNELDIEKDITLEVGTL